MNSLRDSFKSRSFSFKSRSFSFNKNLLSSVILPDISCASNKSICTLMPLSTILQNDRKFKISRCSSLTQRLPQYRLRLIPCCFDANSNSFQYNSHCLMVLILNVLIKDEKKVNDIGYILIPL